MDSIYRIAYTVWETLAGGASHRMNRSCVKTPLRSRPSSTQACFTLNTAPKEMGQSRVVSPGQGVGLEAIHHWTQIWAPPVTTLGSNEIYATSLPPSVPEFPHLLH